MPNPASRIIGISFAPSPIATTCHGAKPRRSRYSRNKSVLACASIIRPFRRPVSLPFSTSNTFAKWKSKPKRRCRRSVKNVNPPDTSINFTSFRLHSANKNSAPGESCNTFSYTSSNTRSSKPASKATRLRKDCSKSSSPRIDCSVIAATSSFSPTPAAISSTHSIVISVESISLTISPKSAKATSGNTAPSICCAINAARISSVNSKSSSTGTRNTDFPDGADTKPPNADQSQAPKSPCCNTKTFFISFSSYPKTFTNISGTHSA